MINSAGSTSQPLLAVPTLPEAWPLRAFRPWVTGMARRNYQLPPRPIVSAGFAGGCQAGLHVGDLLLGGPEARRIEALLQGRGFSVIPLGDGQLRTLNQVAGPREKRDLAAAGVVAVDMETAWLQQAARRHGLPFVAIRAVIDRAGDSAVGLATAFHYPFAARRLRDAVQAVLTGWP